MTSPTAGRIVLYKLSPADLGAISDARRLAVLVASGNNAPYTAPAVPVGGDTFPALVVRVWSPVLVNLQVFLDGPDTLWVSSRGQGSEDGQWDWPPLVPSGDQVVVSE